MNYIQKQNLKDIMVRSSSKFTVFEGTCVIRHHRRESEPNVTVDSFSLLTKFIWLPY